MKQHWNRSLIGIYYTRNEKAKRRPHYSDGLHETEKYRHDDAKQTRCIFCGLYGFGRYGCGRYWFSVWPIWFFFAVADIVLLWPIWMWPIWLVADMVAPRLQSRNRPIFLFRSNSNFDLKPFTVFADIFQHIPAIDNSFWEEVTTDFAVATVLNQFKWMTTSSVVSIQFEEFG